MSDKLKIVLWGTGQLSEVAYFYISREARYEVIAFCMDSEYIKCEEFHGCPVVAFEKLEEKYLPSECKLLFLISYNDMNRLREKKYLDAKRRGYDFISYVSPNCTYYGSEIGENVFIFENNVIQPFSKIGNNVILWSGNHIGHHSYIQDNCFIASHVVVSGAAVIGNNSFLGVNSTIRDNIRIGSFNLIGAGATILKDTNDYEVFKANGAIKVDKKSTDISKI
ncbi:acetyltransferase [Butyrivibrio sp. VCB2006]|uniref:acetyltransferase n=1 Tax=Butyrivibrio sp. VCB2006 TaxID=1280679 RepID=UPI000420749B|nr:acetyltransferase [Butyrivibrio sp. VCB2006]